MDTQLRHSLGPFHAGFLLWLRFLALCVTLVRELVSDRVRSSSISLGFIFGLCCGPGLCVSQSRPSRAETAALEAGSRDLSSASWTPGAGGVVRRAESRWWRLRSGSEGPRTRGDDSLSPSARAGEGRRPSVAVGREGGRTPPSCAFVLSRPRATWVTLATQGSMPPPHYSVCRFRCACPPETPQTPLDQFTAEYVGPLGLVKLTREVPHRRMVVVFPLPSRVLPGCVRLGLQPAS